MSKVALFLINGFEEMEAIAPTDILRRGGVNVDLVSLEEDLTVKGKKGVCVISDKLFSDFELADYDMILLPGGTRAYLERDDLMELIEKFAHSGKKIAAICAAPTVLGELGLLRGKTAVCYPGMEEYLEGAIIGENDVEIDGQYITSKGPATAVEFSLKVLEALEGEECAKKIRSAILA